MIQQTSMDWMQGCVASLQELALESGVPDSEACTLSSMPHSFCGFVVAPNAMLSDSPMLVKCTGLTSQSNNLQVGTASSRGYSYIYWYFPLLGLYLF